MIFNNLASQSTECETGLAQFSHLIIGPNQLFQPQLLLINKRRQEKECKIIQQINGHPISHHISFNSQNYIDNTPVLGPHYKLKQLLYCNGPAPLGLCCLIIKHALQVMCSLHAFGIAHTNLATDCIHIAKNSINDYQIYLSSFENATFNNNLLCENNRMRDYYNENVLSSSYFPKHRDNYSLSVILYLMAFGFKSIIFDNMSSVEFLKQTGNLSLSSKKVWGFHKKYLLHNGENRCQIKEFKEVLDALRGKLYVPLNIVLKYEWFSNSLMNTDLGKFMERLDSLALGSSN